ncbi:hypothetical protein [Persicobacter psychrovividus]|uniref:Uncharacterized protein n=1 Tax=Persicobacter psychrovividus TaxID=387638 RepID=A0ABM7VD18_9BACT|nr:hypothetical protein PEPS_10890 [Persicobacter psychrovividus]
MEPENLPFENEHSHNPSVNGEERPKVLRDIVDENIDNLMDDLFADMGFDFED